MISLGAGTDVFTINSTHNISTDGTTETTTLNTGAGIDLIHINNVSDTLVVNGEADADVVNVDGTGSASESTLNGDGGDDIFNVHAINGNTTINGGDDSDTFNVGSNAAGTRPSNNNSGGNVNAIGALLTINGNDPTSGGDVLNVDETGDSSPNTGALTATSNHGLGMGGSIAYGTVETLNIALGSNVDTFTVESTHAGTTNLNGNDGGDIFNIRTIAGATNVNSGIGADTINIGSNAQRRQHDCRTITAMVSLNGISALLTLNGGGATAERDLITVDDTDDSANNTGILTNNSLTGLGMGNADQSVVNAISASDTVRQKICKFRLGGGADSFTIKSTHNRRQRGGSRRPR